MAKRQSNRAAAPIGEALEEKSNQGGQHEQIRERALRVDPFAVKAALGSDLQLDGSKSVAVGIVVYHQTEEQVKAVVRSAYAAFGARLPNVTGKILIFDNGGSFASQSVASEVRVLVGRGNEGFGVAHNKLMNLAFAEGAEAYVGVNPDGRFHPDCILNLLCMNKAAKGRALLEAIQFPEEHPKIYDPETLETPWVSGACFMMPLVIWRASGGFDENIFLYCEDVDLSWTCRRLGYKTQICASALFYHDTTDRDHQAWRYREMLISARYLGHKWRSPGFVDWADRQLIELGYAREKSDLPALGDLATVEETTVADFCHGFHFAPARWS